MDMSEQNADPELEAIQQVIDALESLDSDAQTRVVAYVFQRLNLSVPNPTNAPLNEALPPPPLIPGDPSPPESRISDIRSLKEAKQPKSDNQMATLVAYYLKELAPSADRKQAISHEDVEKYLQTGWVSFTEENQHDANERQGCRLFRFRWFGTI